MKENPGVYGGQAEKREIGFFGAGVQSFLGFYIPMGRLRNPSEQHEQKQSEKVVANLLFE